MVEFPFASLNSGRATVFGALKLIVEGLAGVLKFGWLNRLKKSILNCNLTRSVILKFLESEKSTVRVGGPRQSPTGAFPKVPNCIPFKVYRFGLIQKKFPFLLNCGFLQG